MYFLLMNHVVPALYHVLRMHDHPFFAIPGTVAALGPVWHPVSFWVVTTKMAWILFLSTFHRMIDETEALFLHDLKYMLATVVFIFADTPWYPDVFLLFAYAVYIGCKTHDAPTFLFFQTLVALSWCLGLTPLMYVSMYPLILKVYQLADIHTFITTSQNSEVGAGS